MMEEGCMQVEDRVEGQQLSQRSLTRIGTGGMLSFPIYIIITSLLARQPRGQGVPRHVGGPSAPLPDPRRQSASQLLEEDSDGEEGERAAHGSVRLELPLDVKNADSLALLAIAGQLGGPPQTLWSSLGGLPHWASGPAGLHPVGYDTVAALKDRLAFLATRFTCPPSVIRNR